jgi:hypothetical protein
MAGWDLFGLAKIGAGRQTRARRNALELGKEDCRGDHYDELCATH